MPVRLTPGTGEKGIGKDLSWPYREPLLVSLAEKRMTAWKFLKMQTNLHQFNCRLTLNGEGVLGEVGLRNSANLPRIFGIG